MEEDAELDSVAMDKILWLIKDDLPKSVVSDLRKVLEEIPGVKEILDMTAFVVIEFRTQAQADAARDRGLTYKLNGQDYIKKFSNGGSVAMYMAQKFKGVGTGY